MFLLASNSGYCGSGITVYLGMRAKSNAVLKSKRSWQLAIAAPME